MPIFRIKPERGELKISRQTIPFTSILLLSYVGLFLVQAFWPSIHLKYAMGLAALTVSALNFTASRLSTRLVSICLLGIGGYLLLTYQATPADWGKAATHNAPLLSLVLTVPLLSSILAFEPYPQHLTRVTERLMTSPFRLYAIASLMITFLSSLLNLASLHFVHHLLRPAANRCPASLLPRALVRGFTPNVMWSPSFISVALAIQYAGISWFTLAPLGISLALAGIVCSLTLAWFEYGSLPNFSTEPSVASKHPAEIRDAQKGLFKLLCQTGLLISMIILLEYSTNKSALVLVPLISLTAPAFLARIYGKTAVYKLQFREYLCKTLSRMHNETLLFSAIGFFGYALANSDFPAQIPLLVSRFGLDTPVKLIVLIIGLISLLSMLGIHPMITIAAIAASLPPGSIALSGRELAGAFLTGYMAYGICSPFSAINLMMSSLTKQNPLVTGLRQNLAFALLYAALSIGIILQLFVS